MNQQHMQTTTGTRVFHVIAMAVFLVGIIGIVAGLGGMVWLKTSSISHAAGVGNTSAVEPIAPTPESQAPLDTQASWPSVPRAEQVFANQPNTPTDDPPAPTF